MGSVDSAALLSVQVAYSPAAREVDSVSLRLPAGSTVINAVQASGLLERHGLTLEEGLSVGVWTKARPLDTPLRDADRVEIYRGLQVDPKEARRLRFRKQRR
jgi:uncharacterized protein